MRPAFSAEWTEFTGELTVPLSLDEAFPLFSPLGEKSWVPGWSPELLHPPDVEWERAMIFRTREESGDAVWVVSALDRASHAVEYHRVEPDHYVARVRVTCSAPTRNQTRVAVTYRFIGLSEGGNAAIRQMTAAEYAEKMRRWERWIGEHVARSARST